LIANRNKKVKVTRKYKIFDGMNEAQSFLSHKVPNQNVKMIDIEIFPSVFPIKNIENSSTLKSFVMIPNN
jgi:hypothetical protein